MTFTTGLAVSVLTGKFAGQTAEVVTTRTDRNGVERVQVKFGNGAIFSYLPANLGVGASAGVAAGTPIAATA